MNNFDKTTPLPNTPQYNTYVGARYVPLYDGDWDSGKRYEPLTVVQFEGRSYVSKTFVAAGIPVSNANFWALSGEYNGQVGQLQEQVNRLETNLNNIGGDVTSTQSTVNTLSTTVETNKNLERAITNSHLLSGKRVYLIGDSITADSTWSQTLNEWLVNTGGSLTNASISGASLVGMWSEVISKMTSFQYDVFILQGGINDLHSNTPLGKTDGTTANSVYWALKQIFTKILSLNNKVVIVMIGPGNLASNQPQYKFKLARIYGYACEGATKKYGGIYIDLGSMPGQTQLNPHGSKDHLHPSNYFSDKVMGQMIIDAINSGGIPCSDLTVSIDSINNLFVAKDGITISSYTCFVNRYNWIIFLYYSGSSTSNEVASITPGWIPNSQSYTIGTTIGGTAIADMTSNTITVQGGSGLICITVPNFWSGIAN